MFLNNKISTFYKIKPSQAFVTSIVILISGYFILSSSSLFIGNLSIDYLTYALVTWFWLRSNELIFNFLLKKKVERVLSFSLSWTLPIVIICCLGLLNLNLPIFIISLIALIDLLFFTIFYKKLFFKLQWKYLICIFIFGTVIIFLSTINSDHLVWINDLVNLGIVGEDTLRDAAILNSWAHYNSLSHGVHGLLFEPYHSLFAHFLSPFVNESTNVFQVFIIFANMIIPSIIVYGCAKIIMNIGTNYIIKNWYFFLLFFILTFANIQYVLLQKSFLMATLVLIGIIPLIYNIIKNPKNAPTETILVCLLVPILIYARAFHGLFILGILFYFLLIKKIPYKLVILSSIIFSVFFIIFYYGQTERTHDGILGFGYLKEFFLKSNGGILDNFYIPIILFFLIIILKRKDLKFRYNNQSTKDIFLYFMIIICLLSIFLILRSKSFSDTFYQLAPIYWFSFFFLLTPNFNLVFFNTPKQKKNFRLFNNRILIIFILFLASINFIQKNFYKVVNYESYLVETVKNFRILNNQWNGEDIRREIFIKNIDTSECKKEKFILICSFKKKVFGKQNFRESSSKSLLNKMVNQANNLTSELSGNTAVFINPFHEYWMLEKNYNYKGKFSLFFMATAKLPIIFGAHPESINLPNSIRTAQINGGTLKHLKEIGSEEDFCDIAKTVKINNIIIFKEENETQVLQCK